MATTFSVLGATTLSASFSLGIAALVRTAIISAVTVAGRVILTALVVSGIAGAAESLS